MLDQGKLSEAVARFRQGLELKPNLGKLHNGLGVALEQLGMTDEAVACFRKAVELRPRHAATHSNLVYLLNYVSGCDSASLFDEHLRWARQHAEPLTAEAPLHDNDRTPDRRLRIGYVSPHFFEHAVNFFTEPVLMAHDHGQFEVFCYSDVRKTDATTSRLKAAADQWRDVLQHSDEQVARIVREDRIDILVDLTTGHIGGNRYRYSPASRCRCKQLISDIRTRPACRRWTID